MFKYEGEKTHINMKNLYIDKNSRAVQCSVVGYGKNFSTGEITDNEIHGFIKD